MKVLSKSLIAVGHQVRNTAILVMRSSGEKVRLWRIIHVQQKYLDWKNTLASATMQLPNNFYQVLQVNVSIISLQVLFTYFILQNCLPTGYWTKLSLTRKA